MEYTFDFKLTEPIFCKHDTTDKPDVEFEFGIDGGQPTITGFKITVEADDEKKAGLIATRRADKMTDLLSATSGTFSEWVFHGMSTSGGKVRAMLDIAWSRRNNTVLDFPDDVLKQILDDEHSLNKRLRCLRDARRAERTKDWKSVISYLNDEAQAKNEPLKCLRNLLTHPENLRKGTKECVKRHYPQTSDNGFELNDTFDPTERHHEKSIEFHANRFLKDAHKTLCSDIATYVNPKT